MKTLINRHITMAGFVLSASCLFNGTLSWSFPSQRMNLEAFLTQVKQANPGLKGAIATHEGAELRSHEADLLLALSVFVNFNFSNDSKLQTFSLLTFDSLSSKSFSIGVSKLTTFGLSAKLHYDLTAMNFVNPLTPFAGIPTYYTNASPILEFSQSLWSNGFGKSTRASKDASEAQALASSYGASFQAKGILIQAEASFWRLVLARQAIAVQQGALDRATKLYEWNTRRARFQLGEKSDVLQAEALVKSRELELISSQNEERSARRQFNAARYIESEEVSEQLIELRPSLTDEIQIPKRVDVRDDLKAAQQAMRASIANTIISLERDSPTLDIVGSYALNGQVGALPFINLSDSIAHSFSFNRPSQSIGIRFTMPIDFETTRKAREGWTLERLAAEHNYDQKVFDQEQNWKDLLASLDESKKNLELSRKLEVIQDQKLTNERDRLNRGRTTTYQVLLFEQDFLMAQLMRIRNQARVLNVIAQMKLFGETL